MTIPRAQTLNVKDSLSQHERALLPNLVQQGQTRVRLDHVGGLQQVKASMHEAKEGREGQIHDVVVGL